MLRDSVNRKRKLDWKRTFYVLDPEQDLVSTKVSSLWLNGEVDMPGFRIFSKLNSEVRQVGEELSVIWFTLWLPSRCKRIDFRRAAFKRDLCWCHRKTWSLHLLWPQQRIQVEKVLVRGSMLSIEYRYLSGWEVHRCDARAVTLLMGEPAPFIDEVNKNGYQAVQVAVCTRKGGTEHKELRTITWSQDGPERCII